MPSDRALRVASSRSVGSRRTDTTVFAAPPRGLARAAVATAQLAGLVAAFGLLDKLVDQLLCDVLPALGLAVVSVGAHRSSPNTLAAALATGSLTPTDTRRCSRPVPSVTGPFRSRRCSVLIQRSVQARTSTRIQVWGQVSGTASRRRLCHSRQQTRAICWPFRKPSDGLEPSTPSLP